MQKTLLIVDDEADLREIITDLLSDEGFHCHSVDSVDAALALITEYKHQDFVLDLIISDLNMPGKTGLEFLAELRKRGVATPFLFLTGSPHEGAMKPDLDRGVLGYQVKPFDSADFVNLLKGLLAP